MRGQSAGDAPSSSNSRQGDRALERPETIIILKAGGGCVTDMPGRPLAMTLDGRDLRVGRERVAGELID